MRKRDLLVARLATKRGPLLARFATLIRFELRDIIGDAEGEAAEAVQALSDSRSVAIARELMPDLRSMIESASPARLIPATEDALVMYGGQAINNIAFAADIRVIWNTDPTSNVCARCEALDGQTFPARSAPVPVRDTHPNCRCWLAMDAGAEAQEAEGLSIDF